MSDKTAGWKFAEGVALDIMKQDRQLISSRAIGMIAAEFDAATAECDCTAPTTPAAAARDALVTQSLKLAKGLRKYAPLMDVSSLEDDDAEQSAAINLHMDAVIFIGDVDRYLAAQEPTP